MCTHGRYLFPGLITLFTQGRRVSRTMSKILVPRSGSSFLVPDPRSSFRILVPLYGSSFLFTDPRSSFRILDPRSGSSILVPDVTYRFITPSTPSEKEASLTPGIIYTIILLTLAWAIPVLKKRNSLKKYHHRWG